MENALQELVKKLSTEEAKILEICTDLAGATFGALYRFGYLHDTFKNINYDRKAKIIEFENRYGMKIKFKQPYYRSSINTRGNEVERGREAETAFLYTTSNRSKSKITRKISKSHEVTRNAKVKDTNIFEFGLTIGASISATSGVGAVPSNLGATGLLTISANLEAYLGGKFIREWEQENGLKVTRSLLDEVELEPLSEYKIFATSDKLDLEQTLHTKGIVDFEVEIDLTDAHQNGVEGYQKVKKIKHSVGSCKDLARMLLGIINNPFISGYSLDYNNSELVNILPNI